jgi:CubicO group peptidase (beta-lactamase class C family)
VYLHESYGAADRGLGRPAGPETRYDIASITKTFTAAAILHLVDGGQIALHDPIDRYLGPVPADKASITVHHLLTHTGGFPHEPGEAGISPADASSEFARNALSSRLVAPPGTRYEYSNVGYGLLAIIVERVAQTPFVEFVTGELIRPNGMHRTGWWADSLAMAVPRAARGYVLGAEDTLVAEAMASRGGPGSPSWGKHPLGAAGLVSTPADLHRWMLALLGGKTLSVPSRRAMFSAQEGTQGYGWTVADRPHVGRVLYRGGLRGGFTSMLALYPARDSTILIFTINQAAGWESRIWGELEQLIVGSAVDLPPMPLHRPAVAIDRFRGSYRASDGSCIDVWQEGGLLLAGGTGQGGIRALLGPGAGGASADVLNEASSRLLEAAGRNDSASPVLARVQDPAGFLAWARPRASGREIRVLGTSPHASGSGRVQTFLRVAGGDAAQILRLIWQNDRLIAWGEGGRLPALDRYHVVSDSQAVAFGPHTGVRRTLRLSNASPDPELVVSTRGPGGQVSERMRRCSVPSP